MTSSAMLLLVAFVSVSGADPRWSPFVGCWTFFEDSVRDPYALDVEPDSAEESQPKGLVCLSPEGGGVQVRTFSRDEAFLEESLVANGERHAVEEGRCKGWQRLDWSRDGRYLFTQSELTCEEGRRRDLSGVSLMSGPSTWVEIQSISSGGARTMMIRRYRPADDEVSLSRVPDLTDEQLREAAGARAEVYTPRMRLEDVAEAASRAAPEVVEAMILEFGRRFPLNRASLLYLSEASVPPRIIDLMVAISFPARFAVEPPDAAFGGGGGVDYGYGEFYDPLWSYALDHPYYFVPFGYYYWYSPWDPVYVVRPVFGPGTSVGRVVMDRGYTRISRVEPEARTGVGRRARRRDGSGGDASSQDGGSGTGNGTSGGSVSGEGYSRGGGSEGRTAKPKN